MALTEINVDNIKGVPKPGVSDIGKTCTYVGDGNFVWTSTISSDGVLKLNGIAAGAEVNAAESVGFGTPVYAGKTGSVLQLRSLKAGSGIQLSATSTEITITNTGGGGGGSGTSKFTELTDVPTNFIGAAGKALVVNPTENGVALGVTLGTAATKDEGFFATSGHGHSDATGSASGFLSAADKSKLDSVAANADVTSAANLGTGAAVYSGKTAGVVQFRSLVASGGITITENTNTITISGASGGVTAFSQLSDVPTSYSGAANKVVLVNSAANGLVFGNVLGTAAYVNTGTFATAVHAHAIADTTGLQTALDAKQPLDADLTSIAALTTMSYGRSFLELADAAAARTLVGAAATSHTQAASTISDSTSVGRSILTAVDAAAVRSAAGAVALAGDTLTGPMSVSISGGAVKGSVSTGTVTFARANGEKQTITVAGAQTWAFSGWPASGTYGELEIICTNAGAAAITLPTVQWLKGDGTTSTTFSSMGVTLQASGTNHFLFWTVNGGSTVFGRAA